MSETQGYAALVAARAPALLRLAVMLTGDRTEAEDLLQATLLRTLRHADRIAAMAAPAAYLRRALVHEHVSGVRRLGRRVRTTPLEGQDVADDQTPKADQRDATWRLLSTLPRQQRAVLVLRFYEDLPDRDIAAALGCSEPTVRSNASRALATLRTRLTQTEEVRP
ncbi:MAG TPA: SigE family RNA polymerase sigma factor [Nocardioides sp.]|nr:SigE family RNA polymerase sigma factor [Nocardioides sp.]